MGRDGVVNEVAADDGEVDEKSLFMGDNKVSLLVAANPSRLARLFRLRPFSSSRSSIERNRQKEHERARRGRPQPAALSLQLMSGAPSSRTALLRALQHPDLPSPDSILLLSCCLWCSPGSLVLVHGRTLELLPAYPTTRPYPRTLGEALRGLWALGDDLSPIATFAAHEACRRLWGPRGVVSRASWDGSCGCTWSSRGLGPSHMSSDGVGSG